MDSDEEATNSQQEVISRSKKDLIISVVCPYIKRTVILEKKIWYYKILDMHPEVRNYLPLIEEILSQKDPSDLLVQYKSKRPNEITIVKECPHLKPFYGHIRIGLRIIDDKEAKIMTVHGLSYSSELRRKANGSKGYNRK